MPAHQFLPPSSGEPPPPWLEALPDSAALIDKSGAIVAVNALWRAFASANEGGSQGYLGENYLEVCRNTLVAEVGDLPRLLGEVLEGISSSLEWEYPCHSPRQRRWFRLIATRFQDHGRSWVVVIHRDITDTRLNEEAANTREQQLESVLAHTREGFVVVQGAGTIRYANPRAGEFLGDSPGHLIGQNLGVPIPSPTGQTLELQLPAENPRTVEMYAVEAEWEGDPAVVLHLQDITDRVAAECALKENEDLLERTNQVARVGGWETDLFTGELRWTAVTRDILEVGRAEPVPPLDEALPCFYKGENYQVVRGNLQHAIDHGVPADFETRLQTRTGRIRWVRIQAQPEIRNGEVIRLLGTFQDITERKEADHELARVNARLANVLESISDAFFTLTPDWCFDYVNTAVGHVAGRPPNELTGENLWSEFPALIETRIEHEYRRAMRDRVTVVLEEYYEPLGVWLDIRAYPTEEGLAVYFRDVTERHAMEEQLRDHEQQLSASRDELAATLDIRQMLINALPAHIALIDADGTILDVNQRWRHFGIENASPDANANVGNNYLSICDGATGECADEAAEARAGLADVLDGERETFSLEYPCHAPEQARWFRMMANRLGGDLASGAVVMHMDITERKLAEQELNRLAYHDALTGIASRNGFVQALADRLSQTGWQPDAMIIMFDIHRHRDINDSHGYTVGDQLLQAVAKRVCAMVDEEAFVGRVGGDEFVVFLPEHPDLTAAQMRAQIGTVFDEPFVLDGLRLEVTARFGYTLLNDQPRAHEELLREAELALFESTSNENNFDWTAYSSAINFEKRQRVEITQELRQALAGNEFQLHFQPKVKLDTGELVASEALLRWYHPEDGLRSPATFIPIAEQSQLIGPIGDWVLDESCRHLREWQDAGLDIVRMSVNVSLVQFTVGDFPETVRSTLQRHNVPPSALTLEITESVFERESEFLNRQLRTLHDMGVRLSLDDFGTGYSSLLYLQKYPFDEIKIDQGFIRRMLEDPYSHQIVSTILAVAGALKAEAIAEGVESAAERDALLAMGCRIGQGFYYSMPLESEDFRWLLEQRTRLPFSRASGNQH